MFLFGSVQFKTVYNYTHAWKSQVFHPVSYEYNKEKCSLLFNIHQHCLWAAVPKFVWLTMALSSPFTGPFLSFQRPFHILSKALSHPFKGPFSSFQRSFHVFSKALSHFLKAPSCPFKGSFSSFQRPFLVLWKALSHPLKALSCPLKGPFSSFQRPSSFLLQAIDVSLFLPQAIDVSLFLLQRPFLISLSKKTVERSLYFSSRQSTVWCAQLCAHRQSDQCKRGWVRGKEHVQDLKLVCLKAGGTISWQWHLMTVGGIVLQSDSVCIIIIIMCGTDVTTVTSAAHPQNWLQHNTSSVPCWCHNCDTHSTHTELTTAQYFLSALLMS